MSLLWWGLEDMKGVDTLASIFASMEMSIFQKDLPNYFEFCELIIGG